VFLAVFSQGPEPSIFQALNGRAEEAAEKVDFAASAPKGASDFK